MASVHLRTLLEAFSGKFNRQRIVLYGYEDEVLGDVSLKDICDILMHHRYFVIHDMFITDLFSHDQALEPKTFLGSKVSISDWIDGVIAVVNSIKVNDYTGMLISQLHRLSSDSEPGDIIFAVQNIHSLERVVRERMEYSRSRELLPTMFDPVVSDLFKGTRSPAPGEIIDIPVQFTSPRFQIGDDLSNLKIEIRCTYGGAEKIVAVDYKELLTKIGQVYRDDILVPVERQTGPGAD